MIYGLGSRGYGDPPSISCLSGCQHPHRTGGHQLVSNIITILPRVTGEWARLQQPEAIRLVCREIGYTAGRDHLSTPGFRTCQITPVTTRLAAEVYRVADLAERYRRRWQVATSLAQFKTTMPMDVLHGQTVPGVLKALTVFAIISNLVRMVMRHSATRQHTTVERIGSSPLNRLSLPKFVHFLS